MDGLSNHGTTQLDPRYFLGLEGQYKFLLHFMLRKSGNKPGEYICRVSPKTEVFDWRGSRSVSCEMRGFEAGTYHVVPMITATRDLRLPAVEDVVKQQAASAPQKLRRIGENYDFAQAKVPPPAEPPGPPAAEPAQNGIKTNGQPPPLSPPPATASQPALPKAVIGKEDADDSSDDDNEPAARPAVAASKADPSPWNAVCVIGLRVYSQDPDVTIDLADAKDLEREPSTLGVGVDRDSHMGGRM